jgi:D-beta-D-heptose 7-phosphate kinase/D-beta-D-heptose 1-phosphate adenosyltransferase
VLVDEHRPTTQKTRVIAHAQQVVRVDREVVDPLRSEQQQEMAGLLQAALTETRGVIVSDYAKGTICAPVFDVLARSTARQVPVLVDPKAPNFSLYRGATVIKPNRKEAEESSGIRIKQRSDAILAGRKLLELWDTEMVLITLGEMGMVLVAREESTQPPIEVDTVAREVYDVSGAGDTVSAVFSLALASGASTRDAAELANIAAGVVVGEIGTAVVTVESLSAAITRSG